MLEYRCGHCKRTLIAGSTFCANCEAFFAQPVPINRPASSDSVFVVPIDVSACRVAKLVRNFAIVVCAMAVAALGLMLNGSGIATRDLSLIPIQPDSIRASMQAMRMRYKSGRSHRTYMRRTTK